MTPAIARAIHRDALVRCGAGRLTEERLRATPPAAPVFVFALGKAAPAMAAAAKRALGRRFLGGIGVSPPDTKAPSGFAWHFGAHPDPDRTSARAGAALLTAARRLSPNVEPLVLLSGGGSALAVAPADGLSVPAKIAAHRALVRAGLPIQVMNAIRAHLSALKGGGLLRAFGDRPVRLEVLSDVGAGELARVASGPCSPDDSTYADCLAALRKARVSLPAEAMALLRAGARGDREETLKTGDPSLRRLQSHLLAGPLDLVEAAAHAAEARGFRAVGRDEPLCGTQAETSAQICAWLNAPLSRGPTAWIAVGEPLLRVPARHGVGGRAQQLALSLASALDGRAAVFLAAGSDGRDGPSPFAGAVVDSTTWRKAKRLGLDLDDALRRCDASPAVACLGIGLPSTPPRTNLTDLMILLRE